ncbi:MAG TPA: hypothetical protein VGV37_09930 [Aliidongia sp.]|uniref:hypothetical protein n=1 Tax=Aliidongia sp. TaxID=1914230 RepID=UPI002DDCA93F|nr:hypothetical protein [Aliidongia sp.]HEV2674848.1 hypothetical protein [Aliidongia sp.]
MVRLLTLGQCADKGLDVEVLCLGCLRRKTVPARTLAAKFGADLMPLNLNGKLKCGVCSTTRCEAKAVGG